MAIDDSASKTLPMTTVAGNDEQFHFHPDTYLELVSAEVPLYAELQRRTSEATVGITAALILDLGAGTGETSAAVRAVHPSARLTGVDESAEMLEVARRRMPDSEFLVQRLEDPLPAGVYDLVVSALAVHHLDGEGKADLFRRIAVVLRPGGRFVLADVVIPNDPADAVTPVDDGMYDKPSRVEDQIAWLLAAALDPKVSWSARDLVVVVAERPLSDLVDPSSTSDRHARAELAGLPDDRGRVTTRPRYHQQHPLRLT